MLLWLMLSIELISHKLWAGRVNKTLYAQFNTWIHKLKNRQMAELAAK